MTPAPGPSSLRRPMSYDDAFVAYLTREDDDWWTEIAAGATSSSNVAGPART